MVAKKVEGIEEEELGGGQEIEEAQESKGPSPTRATFVRKRGMSLGPRIGKVGKVER